MDINMSMQFLSLVWFGMHVHSMVKHGQFYAAPFIAANLSWYHHPSKPISVDGFG
jgi:hypothetical protein